MIKLEKVNKSFKNSLLGRDKIDAVKDVSMSIGPGEIVGIAGESGSGKSTLARLVSGLLPVDSGSMLVNRRDISKMGVKDRKGYARDLQIIFQNPFTSLNPSKTIRQIMVKPLKIHGIGSRANRDEMLINSLFEMGLGEEFLDRYPHQISGGEAQRIIIGRSLLLRPKILILDEATSMLDVSVQAQIIHMLKRIHGQMDMTFMIISHDVDLLRWMCNRIYFMGQGQIKDELILNK